MLIFAFPGTGKTSLAKTDGSFIDLELSDIKYDNRSVSHLTKEERKSLKRPLKQANYRQVYREKALAYHGHGQSVLVALNFLPSLLWQLLLARDSQFQVLFPDVRLGQAYRQRYRHRGNNDRFIGQVMAIWWPTLLLLSVLSWLCPSHFLTLREGETLTSLYQEGRLGQLATGSPLSHGPKKKKIGKPLDGRAQGLV